MQETERRGLIVHKCIDIARHYTHTAPEIRDFCDDVVWLFLDARSLIPNSVTAFLDSIADRDGNYASPIVAIEKLSKLMQDNPEFFCELEVYQLEGMAN